PIQDHLRPRFGTEVDVVCFGDTHDEYIGWYQGVLFLNPGSPSRPGMRHAPGDVGTFATFDVHQGVVAAELHKLRRGQHLG
ncbi:MAG: hypothetical protein EXR68_02025, partial [Dehalococcoidia bacterium]|nr:hypothetical protein [Dehalococcoidia bacterium]